MPTYLYRKDDGSLVEMVMTVAEMERRQRKDMTIRLDDGSIGTRDISAEVMGTAWHAPDRMWPIRSDAAGCHPSQVDEYQTAAASMGVPTEWDRSTGQAIFRSREHRRQLLRAWGWHDKSGGYGD